MLHKVECPYCHSLYDAFRGKCPKCGEPNEKNPVLKKFRFMSFPPVYKQALLFVFGFILFNALGVIIELASFAALSLSAGTAAATAFVLSPGFLMLENALSFLTILAASFLLLWDDLKPLFRSFGSWKPYLAGFIGCTAMMTFNFFYTLILASAGAPMDDNENQQAIVALVGNYPVVSLFIFGIVGPFMEELTYRVGLFGLIRRRSRWAAYFVTILVFALIHANLLAVKEVDGSLVFDAAALVNELLNLPVYLFAAAALTWLYEHFGLAGSLSAHLFNNVLDVIGIIVMGALGVS